MRKGPFVIRALAAILYALGLTVEAQDDSCWYGLEPAAGVGALTCRYYDSISPGMTECIYQTVKQVVGGYIESDPTNAA